jgi:hypothetical protein
VGDEKMNYLFVLTLMASMWSMPWWFVILLSMVYGYFSENFKVAILHNQICVALCFFLTSYYGNIRSHGIAAERLALLFSMPQPWMSYILTSVVFLIPCALAVSVGFTFKEMNQSST